MVFKRLAELLGANDNAATRPSICYRLAACVILIEAARADNEFSAEERQRIIEVMKHKFALTDEEALELLEASEAARENSLDLFRFTNQINQSFSLAEKISLVEEAWRIFYSDGYLDGHEDHLAHKLGDLLRLNHPQLIEVKMRVLLEVRGG